MHSILRHFALLLCGIGVMHYSYATTLPSPFLLQIDTIEGKGTYQYYSDTLIQTVNKENTFKRPVILKTSINSRIFARVCGSTELIISENSELLIASVTQSAIDGKISIALHLQDGSLDLSLDKSDSSGRQVTLALPHGRLTTTQASLTALIVSDHAEIDVLSGSVSIEGMRGKAPVSVIGPKRITLDQIRHTLQMSTLPSKVMLQTVAISAEPALSIAKPQKPTIASLELPVQRINAQAVIPQPVKTEPPTQPKALAPKLSAPTQTIAIIPLRSQSVEYENCRAISEFIGNEIVKSNRYRVLFPDEISTLLRRSNKGDLLDCNADSCLIKSGMALGADYLLTGDIGHLGAQFLLNLKMINVLYDHVDGRISEVAQTDPGEFFVGMGNSLNRLFSMIPPMVPKVDTQSISVNSSTDTSMSTDLQSKNKAANNGMVLLPHGTFYMGSPEKEGDADESPQHSVTLPAFFMDKYEVNQADFGKTMGYTPSSGTPCATCPVTMVSWEEARDYCTRIGKRLPTEAEWEYACRAHVYTFFSHGNFITSTDANFNGEQPFGDGTPSAYRQRTTPAGSFKPNNFGLYDMHGNVLEWCNDWYAPDYYAHSSIVNPQGPKNGYYKVLRGGGFTSSGNSVRSGKRAGYNPSIRLPHIGFRCVADKKK